jgi:hypothetical protein
MNALTAPAAPANAAANAAATVQKITLFDEIKGLIKPEFRF